jgi:hypothetical protein
MEVPAPTFDEVNTSAFALTAVVPLLIVWTGISAVAVPVVADAAPPFCACPIVKDWPGHCTIACQNDTCLAPVDGCWIVNTIDPDADTVALWVAQKQACLTQGLTT